MPPLLYFRVGIAFPSTTVEIVPGMLYVSMLTLYYTFNINSLRYDTFGVENCLYFYQSDRHVTIHSHDVFEFIY
jgi:hypothetical protein